MVILLWYGTLYFVMDICTMDIWTKFDYGTLYNGIVFTIAYHGT